MNDTITEPTCETEFSGVFGPEANELFEAIKVHLEHLKLLEPPKVNNGTTPVTVEALRKRGHVVQVTHFRAGMLQGVFGFYPKHMKQDGVEFFSGGGFTTVFIRAKNSKFATSGKSVCSPDDNFCYSDGVNRALNRIPIETLEELMNYQIETH